MLLNQNSQEFSRTVSVYTTEIEIIFNFDSISSCRFGPYLLFYNFSIMLAEYCKYILGDIFNKTERCSILLEKKKQAEIFKQRTIIASIWEDLISPRY